jgi:hypothetical protein
MIFSSISKKIDKFGVGICIDHVVDENIQKAAEGYDH